MRVPGAGCVVGVTATIVQEVCRRAGCGKPIVQRPTELLSAFAVRHFCDRTCYARRNFLPGTVEPDKHCRNCGVVMARREGEQASDWRRRKSCGFTCARATPPAAKPARGPLMDGDLNWQARAVCKGTEDRLWFSRSASPTEVDRLRGLAREFCGECPVAALCRRRAEREPAGVWGGVLVREVSGRTELVDLLAAVESVRAS